MAASRPDPAAKPLEAAAFDASMTQIGGFEPAPRVAVAVSGGADSLALATLADEWARARGGAAVAVTVDHGIRPESAAEARAVGSILARRAICHEIITHRGPPPTSNVQAAARTMRYQLLGDWCAARGILHLLTAHHADDQAETFLIRLTRGSGLDGLAGMPSVSHEAAYRLVRPLLGIAGDHLKATCRARELDWIEDPSNRDPRHTRVRLRRASAILAVEGLTKDRIGRTVAHLGRARAAFDDQVADCLGAATAIAPEGYARLETRFLAGYPEEVGLRALARVLTTVAGNDYAPRFERLERLYHEIVIGDGRGRTLGGCRILPQRGKRAGNAVLIVREMRAAARRAVEPGERFHWDGRFDVALAPQPGNRPLTLGPLGADGWRSIRAELPQSAAGALPPVARATLPALFDDAGVRACPALGYVRGDVERQFSHCRFRPQIPLTVQRFTVAAPPRHII